MGCHLWGRTESDTTEATWQQQQQQQQQESFIYSEYNVYLFYILYYISEHNYILYLYCIQTSIHICMHTHEYAYVYIYVCVSSFPSLCLCVYFAEICSFNVTKLNFKQMTLLCCLVNFCLYQALLCFLPKSYIFNFQIQIYSLSRFTFVNV